MVSESQIYPYSFGLPNYTPTTATTLGNEHFNEPRYAIEEITKDRIQRTVSVIKTEPHWNELWAAMEALCEMPAVAFELEVALNARAKIVVTTEQSRLGHIWKYSVNAGTWKHEYAEKEEILDWDFFVEADPPGQESMILATLEFAGYDCPIPEDDPWAS